MKIVHLCLSSFFIDNYSYQENILPKFHLKMGNEVTVIASLFTFGKDGRGTYLSNPSEYSDNAGFKVIRLAYKKPFMINRVLRRYEGFYSTLQKESPDIIFSHSISFVDAIVLSKYLKNHPSVKLYADNHADFINSANNFLSSYVLHKLIYRHYVKKLEPFITKCFGVTPMRCRFLKDMYGIPMNKIAFLPMGVDDDLLPINRDSVRSNVRDSLGLNDTDFLIITGGKIDKKKNIHVLIDAIKKLNHQKVHLVICGVLTPDMEYLKETIDNISNIHFQGWCNSEQVMNYMIASDLACFPGTHSTLWEQSVGMGLPSIFKRWPEMEHVNVNNNCVFVKGDDINELKRCISNFLDLSFYSDIKERAALASKSFLYSEIAKKSIGL